MPQHRNEPPIYSGSVISMIGNDAGKPLLMPYKVAQGMVASGQARWEDDPSPMPRQLSGEIAARAAAEEASRLADIEHNKRLKEQGPPVDDAVRDAARKIVFTETPEGVYIARPLPRFARFAFELLDDKLTDDIIIFDENVVTLSVNNATAEYRVLERDDTSALTELVLADQPDVEIPEDWRDRHFQTNIAAARKIRALDSNVSMTKDDAEAIIAEWVRTDDPVSTEVASGAPTNEQGRVLDGNHRGNAGKDEDGADLSAEEIARRKAEEFAAGDDD